MSAAYPVPARPDKRLAELDALRGLAALAVALYHYTYFLPFMLPHASAPAVSIWWGCYGVQLFFAISGFVILGTLERTRNIERFVRARTNRLLPEYWGAMAITAPIAAAFAPERLRVDPLTWLCNLPMLQLWTGTKMVDDVYWSLNVEIGFYAAMALVWRLGWTRRIERVVLGWLAAKWLLAALAAPSWLVLLLLTDHAQWFGIGLVAWRLWTGERRLRDQVPVLVAIVASACALGPIGGPWLAGGMVALFLLVVDGRMRWLAWPALLWMGKVSYPFYLLHAVIGYAVIGQLEAAGVDAPLAVMAALATTGLLATALNALVERGRALGRAQPAPAFA